MLRVSMHQVMRIAAAGAVLLDLTGAVDAQSPRREGFSPVEQGVADVDPLRASLRQLAPGIGRLGQESWIYERRDNPTDANGTPRLYLIAPGFVAEYDRSQYLRITDDDRTFILQKVPPNTVFHIGTPRDIGPGQLNRTPMGTTIPREVVTPLAPGGTRTEWGAWARRRSAMRQSVIEAVRRATQRAEK